MDPNSPMKNPSPTPTPSSLSYSAPASLIGETRPHVAGGSTRTHTVANGLITPSPGWKGVPNGLSPDQLGDWIFKNVPPMTIHQSFGIIGSGGMSIEEIVNDDVVEVTGVSVGT